MAKREHEERIRSDKKMKLSAKKEEMAIDSELLGQQSSYAQNSTGGPGAGNKENHVEIDQAAAAAQAVAAAVASNEGEQAEQDRERTEEEQQQQQQDQQQQHREETPAEQAERQAQQQQQVQQQQQYGYQAQQPDSFRQTSIPQVPQGLKPQHGSDEWHRQRKENHKEVERRRREAINLGIKELASLIPTTDTNKAQILQRAVEYIKRLKENENNNIEKWTLEKLLTEQAVSELSASNEKLKQELERAYREIEHLKNTSSSNSKEKKGRD